MSSLRLAARIQPLIRAPLGQAFVGGAWKAYESAEPAFNVVNPTTEEVLCAVPNAPASIVDEAVKAARAAFDGGWRHSSGAERGACLRKLASIVDANAERLMELESVNMGKPFQEVKGDLGSTAHCLRFYAGLAEQLDSQQDQPFKLPDDNFSLHVRQEPIGVAALIIPWNYPLLMAAWKLGPALAAGCTVILKPSELTPLSIVELFDLSKDVFPAGVVNLVCGEGKYTGNSLINHRGIDKIAFTGSVPTGSTVMTAAAKNVVNITLELGGKSPLVIFDDVDVERVTEWIMFGCFTNSGQVCSATTRVLLQKKIAPAVIERLKTMVQLVHVGDPLGDRARAASGTMGPIVSRGQYEKVMSYIATGIAEGATLLTGGKRPADLPQGFFVEPTVFLVQPHMRVWREEIFGPVLSVMEFDTEEEGVRLANDTEYGLAAGVFSDDLERCKRVAKEIRAGTVWVNTTQNEFAEAPFGGFKKSGIGRELGHWGLQNYLETKAVTTNLTSSKIGWYVHNNK